MPAKLLITQCAPVRQGWRTAKLYIYIHLTLCAKYRGTGGMASTTVRFRDRLDRLASVAGAVAGEIW